MFGNLANIAKIRAAQEAAQTAKQSKKLVASPVFTVATPKVKRDEVSDEPIRPTEQVPIRKKINVPIHRDHTSSQVGEVKLRNPDLANRLSQVNPPTEGFPREQLTVPISPLEQVTDESIFEAAADPAVKLFLPRYRLAEQTVSGQLQYKVLLQKSSQGGNLIVLLEKYPAQAIAEASRTASEIEHAVSVLLRYNVGGTANVQKELEFREVTIQDNGLKAQLAIPSLSELTQIYQAMSEPASGATLVVRRLINVALPVEVPTDERAILWLITKVPIPDGAPAAAFPVRDDSIATLYRPTSRTFDDILPFVFPPALHGNIFQEAVDVANGQKFGLINHQRVYKNIPYRYFQDQAEPHIFYFLPDSFKIARRPESPHYPFMSIRFTSKDGSLSQTLVTLDYVAIPYIDPERIEQAAKDLAPEAGNSTSDEPISFQPLLVNACKLRMALPRAGTDTGPFQERTGALVSLRDGIHDSLTLDLENFQSVYDALFGASSVLFKGEIIVDVSAQQREVIPFAARINDLAGELFDYKETIDLATGCVSAVLTNAIESPVVINNLSASLSNGEEEFAAILQGISFTPAPVVKPGETISFVIVPTVPLATATEGNKTLDAVFDLAAIQVQPNKESVWNAILDPNTPAKYEKKIQVKTFKQLFDAPAGSADKQILTIILDFEGNDSVDLSAEKLETEVTLRLPISDYILKRTDSGIYRYKITVIRLKSRTKDEDWRTDTTGILFPDIPVGV